MEQVKLLIWDLDETLWQGTISDGSVEPKQEFIDLIKHTTDRGIVNSICSKNDFDTAKKQLEAYGIWEYFVFPSINWDMKGQRVKNIIEQMQLRCVNVLFIDDNVNNLKEAEYVCKGIQTTTPDKLLEIAASEAMNGKDDSNHSRLNQYKILEKKAEAKLSVKSNEEFLYQSCIKVKMIEDIEDKLERIHEMIHRNNQLNFTKDRIDQDAVNALFTDPSVKAGVVEVTDKYGDHGIVGCYAVKDNIAVQFVFSCRILGMGVEQYVYSQLGYPEINIVGEVAGKLEKGVQIDWINQTEAAEIKTVENNPIVSKGKKPKVIAYGTCSIRPLCSYISPKSPDYITFKFDEIDIAPSICNIAVTKRFPNKIQGWLERINSFSSLQTFDNEIYDETTDFVICATTYERTRIKYTSKIDGSYFFSVKLNEESADKEILDEYVPTCITLNDIRAELEFILQNLSPATKFVVMCSSEVEFIQFGKDADYTYRIESNRLLDELQKKYSNLVVLDSRKYAKSPSDFYDPRSEHMNRQIGYYLARDFFELAGLTDEDKSQKVRKTENTIPSNAVRRKNNVSGSIADVPEYTAFIRNGELYINVDIANKENYECSCIIKRGCWNECELNYSDEFNIRITVAKAGIWKSEITVRNKYDYSQTYRFTTDGINFNSFNYALYFDSDQENYKEYTDSINHFIRSNEGSSYRRNVFLQQIAFLAAEKINIADFFIEQGIDEISIFADKDIGEILLPFIASSTLKIRFVYTDETRWGFSYNNDLSIIAAKPPKDAANMTEKDVLLIACDFNYTGDFIGLFNSNRARKIYLPYVLSYLMTKNLIHKIEMKKIPLFIPLRLPNCVHYGGFPYSSIKPNEKSSASLYKNDINAYIKLESDYDKFPPQLKVIPKEELRETLKRPTFSVDCNFISHINDINGKYLNIENGHRKTTDQPDSYIGRVFILGTNFAFGIGSKDSETIASHLQRIIGLPYRVENYANAWDNNYTAVLKLLFTMDFGPNDIVIFAYHSWNENYVQLTNHWFNWDAVTDSCITADAFPIFIEQGRPDYFLLPNVLNSEANLKIAKIIRDTIFKNIKLF